MHRWYAPLIIELGMQRATLTGWTNGCFYVPPSANCDTALDIGHAMWASYNQTCSGREAQQNHSQFTCKKLQQWYTPELARQVTRYARNDLVVFDYEEWNGDSEYTPIRSD